MFFEAMFTENDAECVNLVYKCFSWPKKNILKLFAEVMILAYREAIMQKC